MASKGTPGGMKRDASPIMMVVAGVILVLVLGVGAFYVYNGGWKTASQQDEAYKHEMQPIMAAKHGDTEALEAENKLRQQNGQAPLEVPKDKQRFHTNDPQRLQQLREKLQGKQGN